MRLIISRVGLGRREVVWSRVGEGCVPLASALDMPSPLIPLPSDGRGWSDERGERGSMRGRASGELVSGSLLGLDVFMALLCCVLFVVPPSRCFGAASGCSG